MANKKTLLWILTVGLLFCFATAVFYKLGKYTFWHDEANTALLAKSILNKNLPFAFFDNTWVTDGHGGESRTDHLWYFTPWLPFYICAAGFKLFGLNEWGGRFPFALSGVVSALLLFLFTLKMTKSRPTAILTLLFYTTNATTLLYTRQCKYYPLLLMGYLMALYGLVLWQENKKGFFLTAAGFLIMFHCNYLSAGLAFLGFGLYAFLCREGRSSRPLFLSTLAVVSVFFIPFLFLASGEERRLVVGHWPTLLEYFKKMGTNIYYWNNQVFPMLAGLLLFWKRPPFFKGITLTILVSWVFLPLLSQDVLRYNIYLLPLFCFLAAYLCTILYQRKMLWGILFFGLIFLIHPLQNLPDAIAQKSAMPLVTRDDWRALKNYYFKEYKDPIKMIVPRIDQEGGIKEPVFLNNDQPVWEWYSDIPLAFLGDATKVPKKNPPLGVLWTDRNAIHWWIGPHLAKLPEGPFLSEEEITALWKARGFSYKIIDTQIPVTHWDLNSPIRYKHFLNRFSDHPEPKGTIRLIHRLDLK